MAVWKTTFTLEDLQNSRKNTMVDHLGIEFTGFTDDSMSAKMPVDHRTKQPYGILHGGASCALAETVASVAGNYALDQQTHYAAGLEINTSHVGMARDGWVYATAIPIHIGKSTQLWEIRITDDKNRVISVNRLRLAILEKR